MPQESSASKVDTIEKNFNTIQKSVQDFIQSETVSTEEDEVKNEVAVTSGQSPLVETADQEYIKNLRKALDDLKGTIEVLKVEKEKEAEEESEVRNQRAEIMEKKADPTFSHCAPLADFKSAVWYDKLEKENKKHSTPTGRKLNIKDGCLSDDGNLFIFIQDLEGCGKIFKYDIEKNELPAYVQAPHCIDEFGVQKEKTLEFIGGVRENNCITKFTGKYAFMEHTVQDVEQLKRCFETYKHQDFPFSILVSDKYSIAEADNGFAIVDAQNAQTKFSFREASLPSEGVGTTESRMIQGISFVKYSFGQGYGYQAQIDERSFVLETQNIHSNVEFEVILDTIEFIHS